MNQLQTHAYVKHDDMDKFQTEFVNKLVKSRQDIGEVLPSKLKDILIRHAKAPTCFINQHKNHPGNVKFQDLLEKALTADAEYEASPSLDRFLYHLNLLVSQRKRWAEMMLWGGIGTSQKESSRRSPHRASSSLTSKDKSAVKQPPLIATVGEYCDGFGRLGHARVT